MTHIEFYDDDTERIWKGWYFHGENLYAPWGQNYPQRSIQESFFTKQNPEESKWLIHPGCKHCPRSH